MTQNLYVRITTNMVEAAMLHSSLFGGTRLAPMREKPTSSATSMLREKNEKQQNKSPDTTGKIIIPNDPDMQLSIHFYEFVVGAVIIHLLCEN